MSRQVKASAGKSEDLSWISQTYMVGSPHGLLPVSCPLTFTGMYNPKIIVIKSQKTKRTSKCSNQGNALTKVMQTGRGNAAKCKTARNFHRMAMTYSSVIHCELDRFPRESHLRRMDGQFSQSTVNRQHLKDEETLLKASKGEDKI